MNTEQKSHNKKEDQGKDKKKVQIVGNKEEISCAACGKTEKDHKGNHTWQGCNCCSRWFMQQCLSKEDIEQKDQIWKCKKCLKYQEEMERFLDGWEGVKGEIREIKEKVGHIISGNDFKIFEPSLPLNVGSKLAL